MQQHRGSDSDGEAFDGGDQRFLRARDAGQEVDRDPCRIRRLGRGEIGEVIAGREVAARAGDDQRPHGVVALGAADGVDQPAIGRDVERVLALGAIDRRGRDRTLDGEDDGFDGVVHAASLRRRSIGRAGAFVTRATRKK